MNVIRSKCVLSTRLAGVICLSPAVIPRPLLSRSVYSSARSRCIRSPRETLLPHLSPSDIASLPYPPDALPGGRDVATPYGTIKVFEFGPRSAERVLLLHGLSTPSISLSNMAEALVAKGYRVMLFDYFGRGWSDTPDPYEINHDERLYISQILHVLASSEVGWTGNSSSSSPGGGFHVVGYSFGGGLAVSFASSFAHMVRSVTMISPGGLVRWSGNSWWTRLLYSRGGEIMIFPERIRQYFVRRQFEPSTALPHLQQQQQQQQRNETVGGGDALAEQAELGKTGDAFDDAVVSTRGSHHITVASVMRWQLRHHQGFIPAVMSAFRYGPIHERYQEWGRLGELLSARREDHALPGLLGGRVLLILGGSDSIVKQEEIVPDVQKVLGREAVEVRVFDAGHEVAITKGAEVADAAVQFWNAPAQSKET